MPRQKHISAEKVAEREAGALRDAIHKFATAYDKTDEMLLASLNPRSQEWQIKVLNRACEILDDQALLLHAVSNGNGKTNGGWWSPIPENIIDGSAAYRNVTEEMRVGWARANNDRFGSK